MYSTPKRYSSQVSMAKDQMNCNNCFGLALYRQ
jgi:hypothetical protein